MGYTDAHIISFIKNFQVLWEDGLFCILDFRLTLVSGSGRPPREEEGAAAEKGAAAVEGAVAFLSPPVSSSIVVILVSSWCIVISRVPSI